MTSTSTTGAERSVLTTTFKPLSSLKYSTGTVNVCAGTGAVTNSINAASAESNLIAPILDQVDLTICARPSRTPATPEEARRDRVSAPIRGGARSQGPAPPLAYTI